MSVRLHGFRPSPDFAWRNNSSGFRSDSGPGRLPVRRGRRGILKIPVDYGAMRIKYRSLGFPEGTNVDAHGTSRKGSGTHRRRRNRAPRCGLRRLRRTGRQGQIRSTQLRESREPRAESREPRAESREPRAESREPRAESREPRAESREPRAESREPRAESREPRAESREPRAESREPRAESREPRAESREPRAESRAESREPRAESREPRAESREPRAESREPRAESREPREPRAESIPTAAALHASAEPMQVAPTA